MCFTHFLSSDPDPDPDPKTEHTPNAPPLGEHLGCAQVLDPDQDPDSMSVSKFDIFLHFLTADPI